MKHKTLAALIIILASCNSDKLESTSNTHDKENSNNDSISITNILYYKKGKKFNYLKSNGTNTSIYFNKQSGTVMSLETLPNTGFQEVICFNSYQQLEYLMRGYQFKNSEKSSTEIIAYKDGVVDDANSIYVKLDLLKESKDEVEINVSFCGAYKFISGDLYIGKKMYYLKDSTGSIKIPMKKRSQSFMFNKSKFKNGKLDLSVFITHSVDPQTKYLSITPRVGEKYYQNLYVKQIDLNR